MAPRLGGYKFRGARVNKELASRGSRPAPDIVKRFLVVAILVKLRGNFLIAAMLECLGETATLMRKYEVDPKRFLEIMTETLFAAPVYRTYGGSIAEEKYQPAGFRIELGLKDARPALAAAEAKSMPMAVGGVLRSPFERHHVRRLRLVCDCAGCSRRRGPEVMTR
jgi:hypothetical protein